MTLQKWVDKYAVLILIAFVFLVFLLSDGINVIRMHPASVHSWRQSDCAAYALRYYESNNPLFQPATYFLAGKDGKVISEFPLIYYVGAKICHLTGFHYWVFRGLTFLCYLIGLIYLYKIARIWINNALLALFPVLILSTSPFYYYYAVNFLPNVPAIALSFAGMYYLLRFERTGKYQAIIASTAIFVFTTALKPTDGGLAWLACTGAIMLDALVQGELKARRKIIVGMLISSAIIAAGVYGWYKYAGWYNDQNLNHQNLQGLYPIWDMSKTEIIYTLKDRMYGLWLSSYHNDFVILFTILLLFIYIIRWRSLNHFLRYLTLLSMLGTFAYSLMWFHAFSAHDYYQLIFVIAPTFLYITVLEFISRKVIPGAGKTFRYFFAALLAILVIAGGIQNRDNQVWRYTVPEFNQYNQHMYELEPYLEKWGVKKSDPVFCVPDPSPNISLVAIRHKGYSYQFYEGYGIEFFRKQGVRYLIVTDSSYYSKPVYKDYTNKLVGTYGGINVYDISGENDTKR